VVPVTSGDSLWCMIGVCFYEYGFSRERDLMFIELRFECFQEQNLFPFIAKSEKCEKKKILLTKCEKQ
jgi:hypothetical protein